ncbi:endonuclease domain-containing protein [Agromyces subbeticus]|uniref:endonuclease domain-containing protein n=1 Tax=Agromyces subbeticus TaxID=293890 RepID=UPI00146A7932|nr:DUF559 domain-containing protein [Agromyces subbeticus]
MSTSNLDLDSIVDLCRAYEQLLRTGEAFSHTTAALLYGAPLPAAHAALRPLHVLSPTPTRSRTGGTVEHRSRAGFPVVLRFGLPVVEPVAMWLQLASAISREDLTAVGDFLVTGVLHGRAREPALADHAALAAAIDVGTGGRGMSGARWALERIRVGAASRPETLLRLVMAAAGLPEPVIGPAVVVAGGTLTLHPDLAYPELRLAIEYEGDGHRDPARWERDIERRELFEDAGWRVIRVTRNALFRDPDALIARIRRARIARAAD